MRVLVIGAAGRTGSAVVKQALDAGHQVTAFVHDRTGYAPDPRVSIVEGDATDRPTMDAAMDGQDAVVDAIGANNPLKSTTLETSAAATITASMRSSGVRRIVVISMVGEGASRANTNWWERMLLSTFLRAEMKDKVGMEAVMDASGLDWVIVRPPFLSDDPATGHIHVVSAETGEVARKITRADLAAFMVAQLASDVHLQKAVTIAND